MRRESWKCFFPSSCNKFSLAFFKHLQTLLSLFLSLFHIATLFPAPVRKRERNRRPLEEQQQQR